MAIYSLMPQPKIQFFGANGLPLAGGYLYTYYPGTTTPKASYAQFNGTANTNPVVLDSQGRASVWLEGAYDIELYTGLKGAAGTQLVMSQQNVTVASQPATIDASQFFVGLSKITVNDIAPTNPQQGDLWVDTTGL